MMATFTNQATLSFNGNTINSNIVTGNIVEVLTATKTAVDSSYTIGDDTTYIISITNSGAVPFTGITLTDNLGEYTFGEGSLVPLNYVEGTVLYYQNGTLQPSPAVTTASPLTISGITVPAGGNAMIVYDASANTFAPPAEGGAVTNTVTLTGGGITTPVTATETITVLSEPVLSVIKSLSPVNVTENGELTYTFTIQNTGNTAVQATDDLIVSDVFNPVLSAITVVLDGVTLPQASYTYDETTGTFATVAGVIDVPGATFVQDASGSYTATPGVTVLTVSGTI